MIESKYVRSLIYLNGKTITSIALEAGVDPTNLSRSLKGHSTVSDEKMEKVLEHLGVDPVTGTLKPVVHRWKVKPAMVESTEFEELIPDLIPGGGKIIILTLKKDDYRDYRWSAIAGNNGARIVIIDLALIDFENRNSDSLIIPFEEFFPEWKGSFRRITSSDLKKLIEDETLTPSEFDEILGFNYGTHPSGVSFAREDEVENAWTWKTVMTKAREAGLTPREVAERLGLSK